MLNPPVPGKQSKRLAENELKKRARRNQNAPYLEWKVNEEHFILEKKYTVIGFLGSGAYGNVCAGYDEKLERMVAIKKCKNM